MNTYYILAGTNIDPEENIYLTSRLLGQIFTVKSVSNVYKSLPADGRNESPYLNCIFVLETTLDKDFLKEKLNSIETILGRERTEDKFAARTIDLDIVYDGIVVAKELNERLYAAQCFFETAGNIKISEEQSVSQIIENLLQSKQHIDLDSDTTEKVRRG